MEQGPIGIIYTVNDPIHGLTSFSNIVSGGIRIEGDTSISGPVGAVVDNVIVGGPGHTATVDESVYIQARKTAEESKGSTA
jgi:hypothetical protein